MLALLLTSLPALAQLEVLPAEQSPAVFTGEERSVPVLFRNAGQQPIEAALKTRLFQLSATVRMPVGEAREWKRLTVLGGQTVLESAAFSFPEMRGATRFEVRWFDGEKSIGQTVVSVYPTNILRQLSDIAGEKPFGIFDPHEQITPLLRALKLEFDDLTEGRRFETWRGRLAIVGPFDAKQSRPADLLKRATALAERGAGVVWLSTNSWPELRSAVVVLSAGHHGRLVTAPPENFAGVATNAAAQLTLLRLARMAANTNLLELEPH